MGRDFQDFLIEAFRIRIFSPQKIKKLIDNTILGGSYRDQNLEVIPYSGMVTITNLCIVNGMIDRKEALFLIKKCILKETASKNPF